jgi:hypothetical protein
MCGSIYIGRVDGSAISLLTPNYGSLKHSDDLIKKATGEDKINPEIFLQYLKQKYLN